MINEDVAKAYLELQKAVIKDFESIRGEPLEVYGEHVAQLSALLTPLLAMSLAPLEEEILQFQLDEIKRTYEKLRRDWGNGVILKNAKFTGKPS